MSARMIQIGALRSRLEKQPTDSRQNICYFGDRALGFAAPDDCHNSGVVNGCYLLRRDPRRDPSDPALCRSVADLEEENLIRS